MYWMQITCKKEVYECKHSRSSEISFNLSWRILLNADSSLAGCMAVFDFSCNYLCHSLIATGQVSETLIFFLGAALNSWSLSMSSNPLKTNKEKRKPERKIIFAILFVSNFKRRKKNMKINLLFQQLVGSLKFISSEFTGSPSLCGMSEVQIVITSDYFQFEVRLKCIK